MSISSTSSGDPSLISFVFESIETIAETDTEDEERVGAGEFGSKDWVVIGDDDPEISREGLSGRLVSS